MNGTKYTASTEYISLLNPFILLGFFFLNTIPFGDMATTYITIDRINAWWRHPMDTFSALLILCAGNSPVTDEFPAQRPVTPGFDAFFDLHLE